MCPKSDKNVEKETSPTRHATQDKKGGKNFEEQKNNSGNNFVSNFDNICFCVQR